MSQLIREIVMIMGIPCAGKSSSVKEYVAKGYTNLNRDEIGGSLESLNSALVFQIAGGVNKFVLDNTYVDKASRAAVLEIAKKYGFSVHGIWIDISKDDALHNSAIRILSAFDSKLSSPKFPVTDVLGPKNIYKINGYVPAGAIFAKIKATEKPDKSEGFTTLEVKKFVRKPFDFKNKAAIFDYDGTLRGTISGAKFPVSPSDIRILPGRKEKLKQLKDEGYILLGVSNQSGVAKGDLTAEMADACFDKTNELLGFNIEYAYCPHGSFPIACYCRKPCSGLGAYFTLKHKLDVSKCFFVGDFTTDKSFAARSGFKYYDQADFFK